MNRGEFSGLIPKPDMVSFHWSDRSDTTYWLPEVWIRFRSGIGICETALMAGRFVAKVLIEVPNSSAEVISLKAPPGKSLPSVGIAIRSRSRSEPVSMEKVQAAVGRLISDCS
jgi:hypothetical protein